MFSCRVSLLVQIISYRLSSSPKTIFLQTSFLSWYHILLEFSPLLGQYSSQLLSSSRTIFFQTSLLSWYHILLDFFPILVPYSSRLLSSPGTIILQTSGLSRIPQWNEFSIFECSNLWVCDQLTLVKLIFYSI